MNREQLLAISDCFFKWIATHSESEEELSNCVAKDVVVPTPAPGISPDFAGLLQEQRMVSSASSDFKMTALQTFVDEAQSTVIYHFQVTGTHTG